MRPGRGRRLAGARGRRRSGTRERSVAAAFASHVGVLREREELARQSMAAEQLEAGNRTRTALLAAVSHDLRTPLAGLRSATETLQTHDQRLDAAERHELLDAMETSIARLTTMVSDLLDMSRLETGAVLPIAGDVPLGEVVRRAWSASRAPSGCGSPSCPRRTSTPACSSGSSPTSSPTPCATATSVEVEGDARGARVVLRVVDHGPGVEPADRAGIFEPFQRRGDVRQRASGSASPSRAG